MTTQSDTEVRRFSSVVSVADESFYYDAKGPDFALLLERALAEATAAAAEEVGFDGEGLKVLEDKNPYPHRRRTYPEGRVNGYQEDGSPEPYPEGFAGWLHYVPRFDGPQTGS